MSDPVQVSKELSELIKIIPEIKEFFRIKEIFESNKELDNLRREIALAKENKDEERYATLKQMYDNNPLVQNYNSIRIEVVDILKEINSYIKI